MGEGGREGGREEGGKGCRCKGGLRSCFRCRGLHREGWGGLDGGRRLRREGWGEKLRAVVTEMRDCI